MMLSIIILMGEISRAGTRIDGFGNGADSSHISGECGSLTRKRRDKTKKNWNIEHLFSSFAL